MKKTIILLVLLVNGFLAQADQLAYLSKTDAEKGAALIRKQKYIYLFCGCCDNDKSSKVKIERVEVRFTGYENYYEIYVITTSEKESDGKSNPNEYPLDLAYAWFKKKKEYVTVGKLLDLPHDKCQEFKK